MTRSRRTIEAVLSFFILLLSQTSTSAQDATLTRYSEAGFRRFMKMAAEGQLGEDVRAANVTISGHQAVVELVMPSGPRVVVLSRRDATQSLSRYFHLDPGAGATEADLVRVGKALDAAFGSDDPYEAATDFFGASPAGSIPDFAESWKRDGWKGVVDAVERRMTVLTSLRYVVVVIVVMAAALCASVALLWLSAPKSKPNNLPINN